MANQKDTHTRRSSLATPFLRFALGAAVAISLLVAFQQASGGNASLGIHGDVDCSGTADTIDSLQVILSVAELDASTECAAENGDVNCDDAMNAADSLRILRHVHDDTQTLDGCSPRGLVQQLNEATDAGEAEALLIAKVYPALDVGVYTGDGEQILAGAEVDLETDFYLYTFESETMAENHVARQLYGLTTLTLYLSEAGLLDGNDALTDADVLALLTANVTASRGDESMFAWRLVDELGLNREEPLDLTDPELDPATTYLDSLQIFLALYDLTLGLSNSSAAAGEVQAAALDAETLALHQWASNNIRATGLPVAPTHWRYTDSLNEGLRTITMNVSFPPRNDDAVVLGGPLAGYDPAEFISGVKDFLVVWDYGSLTPANGEILTRANTHYTDPSGNARVDYYPKKESCSPPTGQVKTTTHTIKAEIHPTIKSIFPPHSELGLAVVVASTTLQVSQHTGIASLGDSPLGSVADQPCAYEGSASATQVHPYGNGSGNLTYTITASNLRFELEPIGNYVLVRGSVLVQASGFTATDPPCPFTGGSEIPEPGYEPGGRSLSGSIIVDQSTHKYKALGLAGDQDVVSHCGDLLDYGVTWLLTSNFNADRTFDGGPLAGSFDWTDSASVSHHTQWDLHPACPGAAVTPQDGGTCGGAAAFPRAW